MSRVAVTIIAGLLLASVIPAGYLFWKLPPARTTSHEKELIRFSSAPLQFTQSGPPAVYSGVECPVRGTQPPMTLPAAGAARGKGAVATAPNLHKPVGLPAVSMIYSENSRRMAIIDGHVLHEGATLGNRRIVKIEPTRVLLRVDGKDTWLTAD